ncbi:GNAT family N-acetyltransferase [Pelotomaculum propionicicum]|uniref:GNAT family N-acetyltransferase n=1 Tax=Pelotomaculum propionicicum TaxID=258475 RepID=UPI003B7DA143
MEQSIIKEGNILITEEKNPINRIVRFQRKENDKTLACAEISSAGDIWIFTRMYVSEENRAMGYGSEVLTKLTAYLDRKNLDLYAYIYSSGNLSEKQLDAWYRRYGFADDENKGYPLARYAVSRI